MALITDKNNTLNAIRDPMVCLVRDTYYVTGSQPPYWNGINDGVHLWSTKDFNAFTDHGLILKRSDLSEDAWCRDRFWAPELFDGKNGYYYLTFNCRNESEKYSHPHHVGLACSQNITGPYEIITLEKPVTYEYASANDATLFRDDDGTVYIGYTALKESTDSDNKYHLWISKIDLDTGRIYDHIDVCTLGDDGEWDHIGVEGQCIVKRHGKYFQWYSSWTRGYEAGILTADNISGPWKKYDNNPILVDNEKRHKAGHNHSFTAMDGKDYITFHANPIDPNAKSIESFFIEPVEYTEDGNVIIKD